MTTINHKKPISRQVRATAFSLLELLAVVTIIGIISSIVLSRIGTQTRVAKMKMCSQYKGDIDSALDRYYFDTGTWATDTSVLVGTDYYPDAVPICPFTNTAYTINATTHRIDGHNH